MALLNMSYFSNGIYELVNLSGDLLQKLVQIFMPCQDERAILKPPKIEIQQNSVTCNYKNCGKKVKEGWYIYSENIGNLI